MRADRAPGDYLEATVTKDLPPWRPKPDVLEKLKQYFRGFVHNEKEIYPQREHIAEKLGMSLRTLDRYLHHLKEIGWIETTKRTPRTACRTVKAASLGESLGAPLGESLGAPLGESQKKEDHEADPPKETREARPAKQHHQRDDVACAPEEKELFELAGVRPSAANLKELSGFLSAGIPLKQICGGVALGRLRHMRNGAARPITSLRYFANSIMEAGETYQADQLEYTILKLKRELSRRRAKPSAETGPKVA
jgi:hypothetical protein